MELHQNGLPTKSGILVLMGGETRFLEMNFLIRQRETHEEIQQSFSSFEPKVPHSTG